MNVGDSRRITLDNVAISKLHVEDIECMIWTFLCLYGTAGTLPSARSSKWYECTDRHAKRHHYNRRLRVERANDQAHSTLSCITDEREIVQV